MDAATERFRPHPLSALLAGLQSGMLGVVCMLGWLGVSAKWQERSFWTAENLMASVFYGARAIRSGFAAETLSGLAVYLVLYSVLGAVFALLVRDRLSRFRTLLLSVLFAVAWYYVSFGVIWRSLMPLVALLHVQRATAFGHLIYGAVLGMYPTHWAHRPEEMPSAATDQS